MALLSATELRRVERDHEDGISSADIVELFSSKGERFSEATLRKYVQLGLLPMSRRVGIRGRHRGSSGLYPVVVVRLINEIKKALESETRVIPVLVEGAAVPKSSQLPTPLSSLARRNGIAMAHASFGSDAERLIATLDRIMRGSQLALLTPRLSGTGVGLGRHDH